MKCWYCKKEMQICEKVKKIRAPWDLRKKINMHYDCWVEWGTNTIRPLINQINQTFKNQPVYQEENKNS